MDCANWDDRLTDEQRAAAGHTGSHARLLAGPGTGKTHTLGRRVVYLVTQQGISPSEILVLTFTRVATRDLRRKIKEQLGCFSDEMPYISTLHAFALRQLRRNALRVDALPTPLRIADDWEEASLIQEDMKSLLSRDLRAVKDGFRRLSADWETLRADADDWIQTMPDAPFVGMWEEHRGIYGYTLRAELVYQLKRSLAQTPGFELEPRFKHVLIDEYQDLNPCDLAIAEAIANRGASLMACGDDDQSIYGFRYADPSGIRGFTGQFNGSADLQLTECWRCGSDILAAALWVAGQDARRVAKNLRATAGKPRGEVHLLAFQTGATEARGVAGLCRKLIDAGMRADKILILLRSDRNGVFSRPLQDALNREGVPVAATTDKRTVLEEAHGRKLLAMLQIIANARDHLAWRTRLHLTNGIGPSTMDAIYNFARQEGIGFSEAIGRHAEFLAQVPAGARATLEHLIRDTVDTAQRFHDPNDPAATQEELVALVRSVAEVEIVEEEGRAAVVAYFEEIIADSGSNTIADLLVAVAVGRESLEGQLAPDCVNVLTMHQAKGLEAKVVFLVAAEDEIMPRADNAAAVEDDRRLLYVSMTRAEEQLFITYCGSRTGGQMHSGRNPGERRRSLTRFLRNAALTPARGEDFVQAWGQ